MKKISAFAEMTGIWVYDCAKWVELEGNAYGNGDRPSFGAA
jgi:hypothetical protein